MGWMGWTEADTLDTTMTGILLAFDGRQEMLKAIFGGGDDKDKPKTPTTPATPNKIRSAIRMLGGRPAGTGKRSTRKGR